MKYYTGIGSRETPKGTLDIFTRLGAYFGYNGLCLRSGGASGADKAFEDGADWTGRKEIWLPWMGFNGNSSLLTPSDEAFEIAKQYHPKWNFLSEGVKSIHARNVHQVLGKDLKTPSEFVICWTEDGKGQGGTGQAIRVAKGCSVPVFDFGNNGYEELVRLVDKMDFLDMALCGFTVNKI